MNKIIDNYKIPFFVVGIILILYLKPISISINPQSTIPFSDGLKEYSKIELINSGIFDNSTNINILLLFRRQDDHVIKMLNLIDFKRFQKDNIKTVVITNSTLTETNSILKIPLLNIMENGTEVVYGASFYNMDNNIIFAYYNHSNLGYSLNTLCHESAHILLNNNGIHDLNIGEAFSESYGNKLYCAKQ